MKLFDKLKDATRWLTDSTGKAAVERKFNNILGEAGAAALDSAKIKNLTSKGLDDDAMFMFALRGAIQTGYVNWKDGLLFFRALKEMSLTPGELERLTTYFSCIVNEKNLVDKKYTLVPKVDAKGNSVLDKDGTKITMRGGETITSEVELRNEVGKKNIALIINLAKEGSKTDSEIILNIKMILEQSGALNTPTKKIKATFKIALEGVFGVLEAVHANRTRIDEWADNFKKQLTKKEREKRKKRS